MKRIAVLVALCVSQTLFGNHIVAVARNSPNSSGAVNVTRTYPGVAPCNTTLQACINASTDGDTVVISPGTYVTNSISVLDAVNITGNGANPAAVRLRPDSGRMFEINAPTITTTPTTFSGFTIENGNNPAASGGALRVQATSGVPLFRNMVFSNNIGLGGGALRVVSSLPVTIIGSVFYSNTSNSMGGAISTNGPLTLIDSVVEANRANDSGGGIEVDGALILSNSHVLSNTAVISGGGILARNAVSITDSIIATNTAPSGGGLYALGPQTVEILGATQFRSNRASNGSGGGIRADGDVHLAGGLSADGRTLFRGNQSFVGGGGISTARSVYFTRGSPQNIYLEFDANTSSLSAGGAIIAGGEVRSQQSSVLLRMTNNTAFRGGAVFATSIDLSLGQSDPFATLQNNRATATDGGAIYATANATLRGGSAMRGNTAARYGGLIYAGGDATLVQVVTDPAGPPNSAVLDGGCVYGAQSVTLDGGSLALCDADHNGGAVFSNRWVRAHNSAQVLSNTAQMGGGLYATTFLTVEENSTVRANVAISDGGGAFALQTARIANSVWVSNTAGQRGGAAMLSGGQVLSSQFQLNSADLGGALFLSGTTTLAVTGGAFAQNKAGDGGAMHCNGPCDIQRSAFEDNRTNRIDALTTSSIGRGGAVLSNDALVVKRSVFLRNRAGYPGGGGIFATSGGANIENTLFANNFIENSAGLPLNGSVIYASGTGNTRLVFNTFVNTAPNVVSAVAFSQTASLINNVFSGYGVGIDRLPAAISNVFENHNLWHTVGVTATATVQHGPFAIVGDPLFVNPATLDFHLQNNSPAINAGTDVLVTVDFDGHARPQESGYDIGFDEVTTGGALPPRAYLPQISR
jgi:predicted outer membrane repeat protein